MIISRGKPFAITATAGLSASTTGGMDFDGCCADGDADVVAVEFPAAISFTVLTFTSAGWV